ncbi:MAG TPA: SAM-dependent methyltransferase [Burkholderiaceae bacterium]|jgi:SAM-dependent MidA family methyltransferase|nr:SAM-dependent methyltransferase [Burkholderiaceae bacterium]
MEDTELERHLAAQITAQITARITERIAAAGGWLPFDEFMAEALYAPGLGYYAAGRRIFGLAPEGGSDFVTAPELSPFFGRALAVQVRDALVATGTHEVVEFGAGSGALAEALIEALDAAGEEGSCATRYTIVELSGALRARQHARLARFGDRVRWVDAWPGEIRGVVVGNEVLDAMPVKLLRRRGVAWHERGVVLSAAADTFAFADLDAPFDLAGAGMAASVLAEGGPFDEGTVTEIHPQAEGFVASLAERLVQGAALFFDYGFPEHEYYHPQRVGGTLMCHRAHRVDTDPLVDVGRKDITAHVDWSGIALAAQAAGLDVLGYTSQARFLINCGLVDLLAAATVAERAHAVKLVNEHEMGELFKVMMLARAIDLEPIGFASGDRSHRL